MARQLLVVRTVAACIRFDFYPPVLAGPAETSEVAVSGAHRREFGVRRQLVVGVLALLLGALHAERIGVEAAHREAAVEGRAAPVAPFLVEESIHFQDEDYSANPIE